MKSHRKNWNDWSINCFVQVCLKPNHHLYRDITNFPWIKNKIDLWELLNHHQYSVEKAKLIFTSHQRVEDQTSVDLEGFLPRLCAHGSHDKCNTGRIPQSWQDSRRSSHPQRHTVLRQVVHHPPLIWVLGHLPHNTTSHLPPPQSTDALV